MPHRELRARLGTLEDQRRHVDGRLEIVQARLASHGAQAAQGAAVASSATNSARGSSLTEIAEPA